jgi:hypothetical protein
VSSWVDVWGARPILLGLQLAQVCVYVVMVGVDSPSVVLVACCVGAGLSRVTSPVRGALPPLYLGREQLVEFKATVKVWTMVAALLGGAAAAGLGTIGSRGSLLVLSAAALAVSLRSRRRAAVL